ncbi:MAG: hypothetical protein JSS97_18475 [Actinobacteria bacterium]|nr:hypothetical protein [Actinomycetota bacterium]
MSDSTRLGRARGKMLPVAIVSAALVAMLVIVPLASAASSPIASGTTTLTLNKSLVKKAKKAGIKITAIKPTKVKGSKGTFQVTGGEIEVTTGSGSITHNGGLKIKWGKKSVTLKSLTVSTAGKSLSAKIGGKTVKIATLAGTSSARLGFGDSVSAKKVKLTAAGAKALNKITPPPTKTKVKKNGKTITKTVKTQPPFKKNMLLGSSLTEVEPETVGVLPTGSLTYNGDASLLKKLGEVKVKVETISPTTNSGTSYVSALSGGTISPLGTSGTVTSSGGLKLVQNLPTSATTSLSTTITLGSIGIDLAAKTATVEVIGESNVEEGGKKPLNLGNLGRSSIANLTNISVTPSPATRTVGFSSGAEIQPVAAEVLGSFAKVYQGYVTLGAAQQLQKEIEEGKKPVMGKAEIEAAAKKVGEEAVANAQIKSGESLGSFSFLATGE